MLLPSDCSLQRGQQVTGTYNLNSRRSKIAVSGARGVGSLHIIDSRRVTGFIDRHPISQRVAHPDVAPVAIRRSATRGR